MDRTPVMWDHGGMPKPAISPPSWDRAIAEWLVAYSSLHTREAYAREARLFATWCAEHALAPLTARRPDLDAYARDCEAAGQRPATVRRRLAALSSLFTHTLGSVESPARDVRRPKVPRHCSTPEVDPGELHQLFAAAVAASPRHTLVVWALSLGGLRASEVASIDVADLVTTHGMLVLRTVRKGGLPTETPIPHAVRPALAALVGDRRRGPLLHTFLRPWSRQDVYRLVVDLGIVVGIDGLYPHRLRASAITAGSRLEIPVEVMADAMGHADLRQTRAYQSRSDALARHATWQLTDALWPAA